MRSPEVPSPRPPEKENFTEPLTPKEQREELLNQLTTSEMSKQVFDDVVFGGLADIVRRKNPSLPDYWKLADDQYMRRMELLGGQQAA